MTKTAEQTMCSGQVRKPGGVYRMIGDRYKPCVKKASVICSDDKKPYCKSCCPSIRRERDEARRKENSDRWARETKHKKLKDAIVKADAAIVKEALRRDAEGFNDHGYYIPSEIVKKAVDARAKLKAFEASAPKPKVHA